MKKKQLNKQVRNLQRRKRVRAKVSGTADRPRLSVNRSLKHIACQLIDDVAHVTIAAASDRKVKTGTKTERAKAIGTEIAQLAKGKGITKVVFDRAGRRYHGRVKAVAEGAREGGLEF